MRRVTLILSALLVLGVAGCGSSSSSHAGSGGSASSTPAGSAAATGATTSPSAPSASQKFKGMTLRVANCCGVWDTATSAGVDKRFERLTGAKIAYTQAYAEQLAPQVISAHGSNPPYDVVFTDDQVQTELAKLGLIEKMNPSTLTVAKQVKLPALNPGYPPGTWLFYVGFAYNAQKFKQLGIPAPTNWSDLFNPKLAGHVSIPSLATPQGFNTVAAAAAVAGHSQYDLAAGVSQLAKLKLYNVYSSSSQYQTDLSDGNVWLTVAADGRAWQLVDAGKPIKYVVPTVPGVNKKGYYSREFVDITKGCKNLQLAEIYQELASDATTQKSVGLGAGYSPILQSAINQVVAKQAKWGARWPKIATVQRKYATLNWQSILPQIQNITDLFSRSVGNG